MSNSRNDLNELNRTPKENLTPEQRDALNADPITDEPGSHPVGTGLGTAGGAAAGAAIGLAGGPIGAIIGGVVGGIAGGIAGHNIGERLNPTLENEYWRENYINTPYYQNASAKYEGLDYERDYSPAYALGYETRFHQNNTRFEDIENDLSSQWETTRGSSRLSWDEAKEASRDSWNKVHGSLINNPTDLNAEDEYWRENYIHSPYYHTDQNVYGELDYDRDYSQAYRLGYESRPYYDKGQRFEDAENDLSFKWEQIKGESRLKWEQAKHAVKDAWNRITH